MVVKAGPALLLALCTATPADGTAGLAATPPMGFSTWNSFRCDFTASTITQTAELMVSTGLAAAGYEYLNLDDCWMLPPENRTNHGTGPQVPDPAKFPPGSNLTLPHVIQYTHKLGLRFGLYTARAATTCQRMAGSCMHESVDAVQYAAWDLDYLKDDSCGRCRESNATYDGNLADYGAMQQALDAATGTTDRKIVLSIEGGPNITAVSAGGHGNLRRVGTDITSTWYSMIGLVDTGSGLWPYAHNASSTQGDGGGFWNDLDMLEIGNGVFGGVTAARVHMTLWCIMKAPIIMGSALSGLKPDILDVLKNPSAISINQDVLGIQGKRVASTAAPGAHGMVGADNQVVLAECADDNPLQRWWYNATTNLPPDFLYVTTCSASDPLQLWEVVGGQIRNTQTQRCLSSSSHDPVGTAPCSNSSAQQWAFLKNDPTNSSRGQIRSLAAKECLNLPWNRGPDVQLFGCTLRGKTVPENENFAYDPETGLIHSFINTDTCLVASAGHQGGVLYSVDAGGEEWCVACGAHSTECDSRPGSVSAVKCSILQHYTKGRSWYVASTSGDESIVQLYVDGNKQASLLYYSASETGSGPRPHVSYTGMGGSAASVFRWHNTSSDTLQPADPTSTVGDNDNVNGPVLVKNASQQCLTLGPGGDHEVWTAPLTEGRVAVALLNRDGNQPNASMTVNWSALGLDNEAEMSVFDVWRNTTTASAKSSFTDPVVPAHGVTLLILTPTKDN